MSAMGIPQITAIMGMCVAGGAYLPVMCDHILMTEGSGLFLAGPALVQAAIGQKVSAEELDRKSTRLNSSHLVISYAVFCLKKKKKKHSMIELQKAQQKVYRS